MKCRGRGENVSVRYELINHTQMPKSYHTLEQLPVLSTLDLKKSEVLLRRAHHVLAWIMHFYINTLHPSSPIVIPLPLSVPLLEVSDHLALPPLLTYSDDVLYNWKYKNSPSPLLSSVDTGFETDNALRQPIPTLDNLECQTLFTSTNDEAEFYLTSARIELRGVAALALMRATMDEAFVGDALALRRISIYLVRLAGVIRELMRILLTVRDGCDPDVFYHKVRPWFKGEDSMRGDRKWVFEGVGDPAYPHLKQPTELSGPSAGQSSLIHAIDIFLGVDHYSGHGGSQSVHSAPTSSSPVPTDSQPDVSSRSINQGAPPSASPSTESQAPKPSFMARMQNYMPRHHRAFLRHLAANPRPLRALVEAESGPLQQTAEGLQSNKAGVTRNADLLAGYNAAVSALREFRDAHLRVVALYIVGPARRVEAGKRTELVSASARTDEAEKGTGGTNAMLFLKGVRDRTAQAVIKKEMPI